MDLVEKAILINVSRGKWWDADGVSISVTETRQSITINRSSAVSSDSGNDDDDGREDAIFHDQYMCCFR